MKKRIANRAVILMLSMILLISFSCINVLAEQSQDDKVSFSDSEDINGENVDVYNVDVSNSDNIDSNILDNDFFEDDISDEEGDAFEVQTDVTEDDTAFYDIDEDRELTDEDTSENDEIIDDYENEDYNNEESEANNENDTDIQSIKKSIKKAPKNPYAKRLNGIANCGWVAWEEAYKYTGVALPVFNGGAGTWYDQAKSKGLSVGKTPRAKSVVVWTNKYVGHVAYVEKYRASDNKIYIHEGGYNNIDYSEAWVNATGSRFATPQSGDGSVVVGYIYLADKPVTKIKITGDKNSIATKKTLNLVATVSPSDASDKRVEWKSSDPSVASVDLNGKITALKYGKATITATSKDNVKIKDEYTIQTRFYDVNDSSKYYYKPVYWAANKGITKGYKEVYFGPQQDCTRKEMIIFLWRLAGKPSVSGKTKFSDVEGKIKTSTDSYKAILWGTQNGIIKGYTQGTDKGTFKPDAPVTRKDTLIMLYRMAKKPSVSGEMIFKDVIDENYSVKSDTYKAILWGTQKGITKGYASGPYEGQFRLFDNCLREHIVTFIYRYFNMTK